MRHRRQHHYFVYIMSSQTRVLYIGVTNDIERRVSEHKHGFSPGFSAKYRTTNLVYVEETADVWVALERERHLKGWKRSRKVELIESVNPEWCHLSIEWNEA